MNLRHAKVTLVLVGALFPSCIVSTGSHAMIDLQRATLRDEFTEHDVQYLVNETALASFYCLCKDNGWPNYRWPEVVRLVWNRELSVEDYHEMIAHPRDLDLTGEAYVHAAEEVSGRVESGQLRCDLVGGDERLRVAVEARVRAYLEQSDG